MAEKKKFYGPYWTLHRLHCHADNDKFLQPILLPHVSLDCFNNHFSDSRAVICMDQLYSLSDFEYLATER